MLYSRIIQRFWKYNGSTQLWNLSWDVILEITPNLDAVILHCLSEIHLLSDCHHVNLSISLALSSVNFNKCNSTFKILNIFNYHTYCHRFLYM